jgi:hypothetical protein
MVGRVRQFRLHFFGTKRNAKRTHPISNENERRTLVGSLRLVYYLCLMVLFQSHSVLAYMHGRNSA